MSARKLRDCTNVIQMGITQDREHDQEAETEQGDYEDIAVADDRYKIGTEVRVIKEDFHHYTNSGVLGRSGTVVSCVRNKNRSSNYVVHYALVDKCKARGPKVVVKGTPHSFCVCGDEVQHIQDHSGWSLWSYPHLEHWEIPPRDNLDRENTALKFLNVNVAHWGESYCGQMVDIT